MLREFVSSDTGQESHTAPADLRLSTPHHWIDT